MKKPDFIQSALTFKNEKEKQDVKFRKIMLAKQLKMSLKRLENILALEERIDLEFIVRVMWATGLVIRVKVRKRTLDEARAAAIEPGRGKMFPLNEVFGIWKGSDITLKKIREKAWGRK